MKRRRPTGARFTATRLLRTVRQILRRRSQGRLTPSELSELRESAGGDWESSGRVQLVEWVSARSRDGTESILTCSANLKRWRGLKKSVTGSPMGVVARFWTRTYGDAKKVHYALNGWGLPGGGGRGTTRKGRK